jgi:transposase-like protein
MISDTPFKWRHLEGQIILLCVRWYLRYCLSYRDLEEMMAEQGLNLDHTTAPRVINVDRNPAYPKAIEELKAAGQLSQGCQLRPVKYLNNLIEQDHRFIKRLVKAGLGFFSFSTAWRTLRGYETMHMIRKGQVPAGGVQAQVKFVNWVWLVGDLKEPSFRIF